MRVVIAGGGSSGWMTAAAFCKTYPEWDITMINGGDAIGVGESTTPHINQYLKYMGIKDYEFLPAARATFKSSSRFEDFASIGQVFHYPNGQTVNTDIKYNEWMQAKAFFPDITPPFSSMFMPFSAVAEEGKLPINDPILGKYRLEKDRSFHINASAFCEFLREKFCEKLNVIESKIKSVRIKGDRIDHVIIDRGPFDAKPRQIFGDLFIDCTGQNAKLIGALSPWKDFDTILTDTALVKKLPYENKDEQMVAYTNARGCSAGWTWTIPTYDFVSRGFVYSSRFQSEADARAEFGFEDAKKIEFKNGRRIEAWVGNCVAIGLSHGFIEPLESTSLFNTHHGILVLLDTLRQHGQLPGQFARDVYNHDLSEHMDGWREFVEAHYYYSKRRDTPFWRAVTDEVRYEMSGSTHETVRHMMSTGEPIPTGHMPIVYILAGSDFSNINTRHFEYFGYPVVVNQKQVESWQDKCQKIKKWSETQPTMYKFLKGTFDYGDDDDV